MAKHRVALFLAALYVTGLLAAPASADGPIIITHAKALAGGVTPGDGAGYPVTLFAASSYKLGSNLSPGSGQNAIVVASADVTIDLDGFRISGGPAGGANNALVGIFDLGDRLTVKNGTIGAFKTAGIYAPNRPYLIVENMRIINSGVGINNSGGSFTRIQNTTVATNIGNGIYCGVSCQIEGSLVSDNGGTGILITTGTILGNTISSNAGWGLWASVSSANNRTGIGNNTIINNHHGDTQKHGFFDNLFPNACWPTAAC